LEGVEDHMPSKNVDGLGASGITKDPLVGLRVQVGFDEPEDARRLGWLSGTITKMLSGGGPSYVVHLGNSVTYAHVYNPPITKRIDWVLTDLCIQARYVRHELNLPLTQKPPVHPRDSVVVGISNLSTGDYFAIGAVRRAE
jgi:hypothetical protein